VFDGAKIPSSKVPYIGINIYEVFNRKGFIIFKYFIIIDVYSETKISFPSHNSK
jgi:hypothetical protein